ncbi:hypothetical protein FHT40_005794 [Mycolicibacterium sp. BK556]|uniref:hypothetical protein n=1 Tax=unclassified Mycolicibacterium TaxID=2636767 RepID=UPI00161DC62E|nr:MULTISPECIES: hypothetical protein [unclassified Mycolicibacterium]MBB3606105.1 hypothetical protein [Mycolicibacterium sp. BK556]MBB3632682.1 hypothetical protein [Mycolicibacterium sp. BK607]
MLFATEQFNLPVPPDMTFPRVPQIAAEMTLWFVVAGFVIYAVREWRRTGSPLALILLAGGGIALLNEPLDDILGLVHHPRPGQHVIFETMGPIPHWGLPTYIIFFGGIAYVLLAELRKLKFTPKAFWTGIAITFVADLLIEVPLLHFRLYTYFAYGDVPMSIGGFPLYWLFINTTGPILTAAILFAAPNYFRGWRAPLVIFLPLVTDTACSAAVGLPVYNALHTPGAPAWVTWGGALASCAIGMVLLDAMARWIYARTRDLQQHAADTSRPVKESI